MFAWLGHESRKSWVFNWSSVGLVIFVSSFFWAPSRDGLESIYALTFFIPMLFWLPWRKPDFNTYGGYYTLLAMIYGVYAAATTFWAPVKTPGYFGLQIAVLFTWLAGVSWIGNLQPVNLVRVYHWLFISAVVVGGSFVISFYSVHPFNVRLEGWSVLHNANVVGNVFGVAVLLAFVHWINASGTKNIWYFLLMVILCVPLLLSQNRGGLLSLAVVAVIANFLLKPTREKLLIQLGGVVAIAILCLYNLDYLLANLHGRGDDGDRALIWREVFWRSLCEHSLFGQGMEKDGRIIIPDVDVFNHAHNAWLDMFYRTGLIGLFLSLLHLGYIFRNFSRAPTLIPLYLWLIFGCLTCVVDSRGFFWQIDAKWFLYWIPAGLIAAIQSSLISKGSPVEKTHGQ